MKVDLKETITESEPSKALNLEAPYFKFSAGVARIEALKPELEALRDKRINLDAKMFGFINAHLKARAPRLPAHDFELGAVLYEDTIAAIRDSLYKRMKFDSKPKQTALMDPLTPGMNAMPKVKWPVKKGYPTKLKRPKAKKKKK